jgi:hypothetical protein
MADEKKRERSPLEELDERHAADTARRKAQLAEAHKELKAAQQLVNDCKATIAVLQNENIRASFAYDAKRAALLPKKKAA